MEQHTNGDQPPALIPLGGGMGGCGACPGRRRTTGTVGTPRKKRRLFANYGTCLFVGVGEWLAFGTAAGANTLARAEGNLL